MHHSVILLTSCLINLSAVLAQAEIPSTCSGTPIAEAQALIGSYPPVIPGQIAQILPGDSEATALYQSILASNSSYLSIPPSAVNPATGSPALGTYDWRADPYCWWSFATCVSPNVPDLEDDISFCEEPSTWGLTIDDGPTCAHGPQYDLLAAQNPPQLASVYYIGVNVLSHPQEAQRGYNQGLAIGVHTWSHHPMTTLTNEQVFAELYYTKKVIKDVVGVSVRSWRPPYGDVDNRVRFFAQALDMRTHIWNQDTDDFDVSSLGQAVVEGNYNRIISQEQSSNIGIVVLNHEISPEVVSMFVNEYPTVFSSFKHVTPLEVCANVSRPYAEDETPDYPNFAAYVSGARYKPWNSTAYSNSSVVYLGNGTAAQIQSSGIKALALASSASIASASSASVASVSATHAITTPVVTVNAVKHSVTTTSDASKAGICLLSLVGLLALALDIIGWMRW